MHVPRPSAAHRWVGAGCTASVRLGHNQPDTAGPYAIEGRDLHDLAARVLRGDPIPPGHDDDLREVVAPYVKDVRAFVGTNDRLHVEETLGTPNFGGGALTHPPVFGTPDAYVSGPETVIWDLKTGWSLVEVFENWQILMYAAMLPRADFYTLRIVQPRPWHPDGPIRSWTIDRQQLEGYIARIVEALGLVFGGRDYAVVSPACRYCPAVLVCPAIREATLAMVDISNRDAIELPDTALAGELAALRSAADRIGLRATALEERIEAKIRKGERVPGASMKEGRGRRHWRTDVDAVALVRLFSGTDISRPDALTPDQAIKAGVPREIVAGLAERSSGAMKVVLGNDQIRRAFAKPPKEGT